MGAGVAARWLGFTSVGGGDDYNCYDFGHGGATFTAPDRAWSYGPFGSMASQGASIYGTLWEGR